MYLFSLLFFSFSEKVSKNDQHSHESGFQSATSLNSLEGPSNKESPSDSPPGSTLTGSTGTEIELYFLKEIIL